MAAGSVKMYSSFLKQISLIRPAVVFPHSVNLLKNSYRSFGVFANFTQPSQNSQIQCCSFHTTSNVFGKQKKKKSWYRMYKRQPALTKLRADAEEKITERKAFGGGKKQKALRVNSGKYSLKSLDVELEVPIKEVVWNDSNKDFTKQGIMVKGTIVEIDAYPFQSWLEQKKESNLLDQLDPKLVQQLQNGKFYAKISTRPGQVGACNGDILEGQELDNFLSMKGGETLAA